MSGLTAPAGHLSWTGLVCAVLWRERLKVGHATLNWRVVGAFLTAVVLHALGMGLPCWGGVQRYRCICTGGRPELLEYI